MQSDKRYRLKKEIISPDLTASAGTIGVLDEHSGKVWFGEDKRFFYMLSSVLSHIDYFEEILPVSDEGVGRIEVVSFEFHDYEKNGAGYYLVLTQTVDIKYFPAIKRAIEDVLNGENKDWPKMILDKLETYIREELMFTMENGRRPREGKNEAYYYVLEAIDDLRANNDIKEYQPLYTEKDIHDARKQGFEAGRKKLPSHEFTYKYATVNDYLSTLSMSKEPASAPADKAEGEKRDWEVVEWDNSKVTRNSLHTGTMESLNDEGMIKRGYIIHSVRRISDGQVFTVGDEVYDYGAKITLFAIVDGELVTDINHGKGHSRIPALWLLKKPSSTPEQAPFNWVVFTEDGFGFPTWKKKDWRGDRGSNWDDTVKTFLTRTECEEYILNNKPCLSVSDIMNQYAGKGWGMNQSYKEDLTNLAKYKQQ